MLKSQFQTIVALCFLAFSCQQKPDNTPKDSIESFSYGSRNDSALAYFNKGWLQIMDNGQWTLAEESFRKAVEIDPDFLIGQSLVGRITQDLDERKEILNLIEQSQQGLDGDEKLLLDVYVSSLGLLNARDQKQKITPDRISAHYSLSEKNFKKFVHRHPEESYIKAEYVEVLHANHGADQAIDSLDDLASSDQKDLPFFIGYKATMLAETGRFNPALSSARKLKDFVNDPAMPAPYVVFAAVYSSMDSLVLAKKYIDKAVVLDPNHLIAQSLKKELEDKIISTEALVDKKTN